jgi:putative addiction module killer protein
MAKARIVARLRQIELGNLGDLKPVGDGVMELRVHVGAGYRVYCSGTANTGSFFSAEGIRTANRRI